MTITIATNADEVLSTLQQELELAARIFDPQRRELAYHQVVVRVHVRLVHDKSLSPEQLDAFGALDRLAKANREAAAAEVALLPLPLPLQEAA